LFPTPRGGPRSITLQKRPSWRKTHLDPIIAFLRCPPVIRDTVQSFRSVYGSITTKLACGRERARLLKALSDHSVMTTLKYTAACLSILRGARLYIILRRRSRRPRCLVQWRTNLSHSKFRRANKTNTMGQSANELYRLSDNRWSANFSDIFCG
jgi:hypothetical protein